MLHSKRLLQAVTLRLLVYLSLAYLTTGLFLYFRQDQLLFPASNTISIPATPTHLPAEDLLIPVNGKDHLHAWWIPAAPLSQRVILCLHGNGYALDEMTGEAEILHAIGANLLLVDYRGYGSSTKLVPNETTVTGDARAALVYLLLERKLPVSDVFLLGRSVGSGPATQVASETSGLGGLILESAFTSIDDVVNRFWYAHLFPVNLMLHAHFNNLAKISLVQAPVLIIAGTSDSLTPLRMSEQLFAQARNPKQICRILGAAHDDLLESGGNQLIGTLQRFVQR